MKFLSNPLYILGAIILIQIGLDPNPLFWQGVLFLVVMAYVQNVSYGLQARAGTRSSNAFHLVTSVLASLVFFATFRYLVRDKMPLSLLSSYMFGTIFGSLHGNIVSRKIENLISAHAEAPKNQPQLFRFWPSIIILLVLMMAQVIFIPTEFNIWMVLTLATVSVLDNFSFAVLRLARSSDNYWFHGFTALFQVATKFISLAIMINYQMDWMLFWPSMTGGVVGSLTGQYFARNISDYINAKFDSHVSGNKKIDWPVKQILVFSLGMVIHLIFFGVNNWLSILVLLVYAIAQSSSFAIVSRARQRNHAEYLTWASVFSNGVWYLTMHQLSLSNITPDKTAPYLVGNTVGSLTGQNISMHVEKAISATMDSPKVLNQKSA